MIHPSMMPGACLCLRGRFGANAWLWCGCHLLGGGAAGARPQPPPNLYHNVMATPAASPPLNNAGVSPPMAFQYSAPVAQPAPPAYAPAGAVLQPQQQQPQQQLVLLPQQQAPPQQQQQPPPQQQQQPPQLMQPTGSLQQTPVKKPDQQPSFPAPTPPTGLTQMQPLAPQQQQPTPLSPVTPLFATPAKDALAKDALPPVPLRLSQPQQAIQCAGCRLSTYMRTRTRPLR